MASIKDDCFGSGKHFTDKLRDNYNWDIVMLARGGCSNFTIRLQIDEIIKHNPDLIIVGTTAPDRIEIPIKELHGLVDLYDIEYKSYWEESSKYFQNQKSSIISQNIYSLTIDSNHPEKISDTTMKAIKQYVAHLYDKNYKETVDNFIISDGVRKLKESGIPFYVCIWGFQSSLGIVSDRFIYEGNVLSPHIYWEYGIPKEAYPFHTMELEQDILAKEWGKKIKSEFGLG
jgi:hypothetical protein